MRHIPNILSGFRILLVPLFAWQMTAGNAAAAAGILILSGVTDMLDGMLARKFGWITQLGKVLDPAADKLTQVTVCIMLAIHLRRYWWLFAILLLKELVMLILGGGLLKKGVKLDGAKWFGKITTVLFYVTMTAIVLFPGMPHALTVTLLAATVLSAVASALLYIPEYRRYRSGLR